MAEQDQYEVGFGKPPKDSQWKPGQSGNPNGRPRKTKDFERLLDIELSKEITITEGGQSVRISKRELFLKTLVHDALKGDLRAMKMLLPHIVNQQSVAGFEPNAADRQAFEELMMQYEQINDTESAQDSETSDDKS